MNNDTSTPITDRLIDRLHVRHKKDESFTREDRYKAMVKHARDLERIADKLADVLRRYYEADRDGETTGILTLRRGDATLTAWEKMKEAKA